MKVRPMSDNVFLRDLTKNRVSKGGLHVPDSVESDFGSDVILCEVIKAGDGGWGYDFAFAEQTGEGLPEQLREQQKRTGLQKKLKLHRYEVDVKQGEKVLIDRTTGELLTYGLDMSDWLEDAAKAGEEVRVVRSCQILAVVE